MNKKKIIIGPRGSKLALIYAEIAKKKLLKLKNKFNFGEILIQKIKTDGDLIQDIRLSDTGGKGLFSSSIEKELQKGADKAKLIAREVLTRVRSNIGYKV